MLDVSFQINGKKTNASSFKNELEKAVYEEIKESIEESVRLVHCSIHHEYPKLIVKGKDLNSLSVNVEGCCDTLIEATLAKLQ